MTLEESNVLSLIGLERFEIGIPPALLVLLKVLNDVVVEEGLQDAELVIVCVVEVLAFLGLHEGVALVLVAIFHDVLIELLQAEGL